MQNSQLWDLSPWSGRSTQHFPTEAGQPGWTCSSTQIIFFRPSPFFCLNLKNAPIPQKLCPLPGTCLLQAALAACNHLQKKPLCSPLDTIPLALNHFEQLRQGESGLSLAFWLVVRRCWDAVQAGGGVWRAGLLCGYCVATVWPCCIALETVRKPCTGGCFTNGCWWQ